MDDLLEELDSFDRATPADRDRRRRFVATAAICGLAFVGIGQLATGALFEDSANASVTYTTGDVRIEANGSASDTLPAAANLAPGDTVFRAVTITNVGTLDLRYSVTGETISETKSLSSALRYTIYRGLTPGQCSTGAVGPGVALASNAVVGTAPVALIGNSATGAQAGDRDVAAGNNEVLCVAMNLPLATTSAFATANAQVTLTFNAEQTKNN